MKPCERLFFPASSERLAKEAAESGQSPMFSRRDLLDLAVAAEDECDQWRRETEELQPKAEFYDRVVDSQASFSLGETAKMLAVPGYGRNNLIRFLRERGILMTGNVPKQRYMDCGYFRVIQSEYAEAGGAMRLKTVTRVREKGVDLNRRQLQT